MRLPSLTPSRGTARHALGRAVTLAAVCLALAGCGRQAATSSATNDTSLASNSAAQAGPGSALPNAPLEGNGVPIPPKPPDDPLELLKIGNALLAREEPARAIAFFNQARQLDPDDEEIHFNLGFAYAKIGMTNEATHHYLESLRIFPDYVEAHNNLGNLLIASGDVPAAMEHFAAALRLMPEHVSALNNMGKCLAIQGRTEEAVNFFQQSLRVDARHLDARFNMGVALLQLNRIDEAIGEFEEALRLRPGFRPAALGLQRARALQAGGPAR